MAGQGRRVEICTGQTDVMPEGLAFLGILLQL